MTEQEQYEEMVGEMSAISDMLVESHKHGLQVEVVRQFVNEITQGFSIPIACEYALAEWIK